jgi:HAD superfamily hydrolase (TIGR01509 family)
VHNGKPAPDIFQVALSRLHIDPSNCLVFEDENITSLTLVNIHSQQNSSPKKGKNHQKK